MNTASSAAIFLPVLAVVVLTAAAFVRLVISRVRSAREDPRDPAYYQTFVGAPEPDHVIVAVRHYGNLFELPVLFYLACVIVWALQATSFWTLGLAWGYVAARYAQSAIHLTYNSPSHRGLAFSVGWLFVIALWAVVAAAIFRTA